jgi:hypothetical protein
VKERTKECKKVRKEGKKDVRKEGKERKEVTEGR